MVSGEDVSKYTGCFAPEITQAGSNSAWVSTAAPNPLASSEGDPEEDGDPGPLGFAGPGWGSPTLKEPEGWWICDVLGRTCPDPLCVLPWNCTYKYIWNYMNICMYIIYVYIIIHVYMHNVPHGFYVSKISWANYGQIMGTVNSKHELRTQLLQRPLEMKIQRWEVISTAWQTKQFAKWKITVFNG